ncbi:MAG: N-acetyl-gamma-glutamyl-phosphate reductase [Clostridia bacterium]|nr:N-acetyl-gamma-glutamyl-phosphate reductase [Clostridia bacterium]
MKKVFIDGSAGTTGLRIKERLAARNDIETLVLPEETRKDENARKECIFAADAAILCLPDEAARQALALAEGAKTVIIDTSTAHRTDPRFVYGFAELKGGRERIANSKRIANPGCHACGFIALVAPLTEAGLIAKDTALTCFSLTGYSGGGKKMIADYESPDASPLLGAPRIYGLNQNHKHLPEMQKVCGLETAPAFCPTVAPYSCGLEVSVPLFAKDLKGTADDINQLYREYYAEGLIRYAETDQTFLSACEYAGYDDMEITVCGNGERILLVSRFDNLGKGASGSAIQNLNICLGLNETAGLKTKNGETE